MHGTDALPNSEELKLIEKLRLNFKDAFEERAATGSDHPCLFGDLALARVLRGSEGNFDDAVKWFSNFLSHIDAYNIDARVLEMTKKLDESASQRASVDMLPFKDEVYDYFRVLVTAPELSPKGDVIMYLPVIDFDKRGIYEDLDWDHWVEYQRSLMVLRAIECDRLSRCQKRIVRCILIVDIQDCTLDNIFFKAFDRDHEDNVNRFTQTMFADLMGPIYVVNPSWKISTLGGLLKRVAPEKLTKKIFFQSGDGLGDKSFVKLAGGRTQLENMYATRAGLVLKRQTEVEEAAIDPNLDCLATETEKELIALLRADFQDALEAREKAGTAWPFFFGDEALTRVLRGNSSNYKAAKKWLTRFLTKLEEYKVDETLFEMCDKFEKSGQALSMEMAPCYDEVKEYCRLSPCAPSPTKKGDFVQYIAVCDVDRHGILNNVKWESWVSFMRGLTLFRCMYCDSQSKAQGRLVRCICIYDLSGQSLSSLRMPEFMKPHSRDVSMFQQHISIETLGRQYVINAPWLMAKMFHLFSSLLPSAFTQKLCMLESDGSGDADFLTAVGGRVQLKQLIAGRVGLCAGLADQTSGTQEIAAGSSFDRFLDVRAGQRAVWSFEVSPGFGDGLLGTSDVEFSAKFYAFPGLSVSANAASFSTSKAEGSEVVDEPFSQEQLASEEEAQQGEVLVPSMWVTPSATRVEGSHLSEKDGSLMLTWSNEHSTLRGKSVIWSVEIEKDTPPDGTRLL